MDLPHPARVSWLAVLALFLPVAYSLPAVVWRMLRSDKAGDHALVDGLAAGIGVLWLLVIGWYWLKALGIRRAGRRLLAVVAGAKLGFTVAVLELEKLVDPVGDEHRDPPWSAGDTLPPRIAVLALTGGELTVWTGNPSNPIREVSWPLTSIESYRFFRSTVGIWYYPQLVLRLRHPNGHRVSLPVVPVEPDGRRFAPARPEVMVALIAAIGAPRSEH